MTEQEWLTSSDPAAMLEELRRWPERGAYSSAVSDKPPADYPGRCRWSNRLLRLFAVACCRQVWDGVKCGRCKGERKVWDDDPRLGIFENYRMDCPDCRGTGKVGGLSDPRSRRAVEVAERYADGLVLMEEYHKAVNYSYAAAMEVGQPGVRSLAALAHDCLCSNPAGSLELELVPPAVQCALLRDIFGNPFRPAPIYWTEGTPYVKVGEVVPYPKEMPSGVSLVRPDGVYRVCRWLTPTVLAVAQTIYDERRFEDMPILGDALEEAGCSNEDILWHCHGEPSIMRHVRGCWVLDLILGKE